MTNINNLHRNSPTLNGLLTMARDALMAQQSSMSVIGHNVSNVNTEGYSRQRLELTTNTPLNGNPGQFGTGVTAEEVQRISNEFVVDRLRYESGSLSRWSTQRDNLAQVEEVFSEIEDHGLSNIINEFWLSWQDLANDPDALAGRVNVIQKAQNLSDSFRNIKSNLVNLQENMNQELKSIVDQVNNLTERITSLNEVISSNISRGQNPNDLLDERDLALNDLSELIGINVQRQEDGSVSVYLGDEILVQGNTARNIAWQPDASSGKDGGTLVWQDSGNALNVDDGKAYGIMYTRDKVIPQTLNDLDELADNIREQVNNLHLTGIGLDGSRNVEFWRSDTSGADGLIVNSDLVINPEKLAASSVSATGDNALAQQIYDLRDAKVFSNNSESFAEFYRGTIARISTAVTEADLRVETASSGLEQAENWREQISGVSLDEEMANLLLVQRTFTATSRVLQQTDELIATLISLVG